MNTADEDFSRFLKANFEDDWRRYTSPNTNKSTINSIKKKHEQTYTIWKKLSNEDWIRSFYGDKLPPELLSGHISSEYLRIHMQEYMYSPLIYHNEEVIAIRTQYIENLPNMVYSIVPLVEIDKFRKIATEAGLCEKSLNTAIVHETDKWKYMAKLESVGLTETEANQHIKQLQTIDAIDQLSQAYQACINAKTTKEKEIADKNLRAQCTIHFDTLNQNRDIINTVQKQLIDDEQKDSLTPNTANQLVSNKPEISTNSNLKPTNTINEINSKSEETTPQKTITKQQPLVIQAKDTYTESLPTPQDELNSIYTFAIQNLDKKVDSKLHSLDKYITEKQRKYTLSPKTKEVPKNALQKLNIRPDDDICAKYLRTRPQSFKSFAKDLTTKFQYETAESLHASLTKKIEDIRNQNLHVQYQINLR